MKTLSEFYRSLGLSRVNDSWSWGVATEEFVILQVWSDEYIGSLRAFYVWRDYEATYRSGYASPGLKERLHHLDLIRDGSRCYFLVIHPNIKLSEHDVRGIATFNKDSLLVADGKLIECEGGNLALSYCDRINVSDLRRTLGRRG